MNAIDPFLSPKDEKKFLDYQEKSFRKRVKDRAPLTLEWYEKIAEMIDSGQYYDSEVFLYSVMEFIEIKEYITDKQIEAVIELANRSNMRYGSLPF